MFQFLQAKTEGWKPHHKICALTFDEMNLTKGWKYDISTDRMYGNVTFPDSSFDKERATYGLVFMLAGRIFLFLQYQFLLIFLSYQSI